MLAELATIAIAILLIAVIYTRKTVSAPGPTEYPIIQGLPFLLEHRHHLLESLVEFSKKYQTTWTVKWPLSPRFFFTTDPKIVERILKENFENYIKGPYFDTHVGDLLGGGIFNSDGERWDVQRKLATHMFSRREFQENIITTFVRHARALEGILDAAAASGEPIDMQSVFFRFTLDSIGDIAFGHTVGALKNPDVPFARAFDKAQAHVEHRFFTPAWQILEHFDGSKKILNDAIKLMDEYSQQLIQQRRDANDYQDRRDLLSRFMSEKDEDGNPRYLNDDAFLRDVIMNFMIAGRDTTAQALSWSVYNLSQHPEVAASVAQEARALLGTDDHVDLEKVTYDLISKNMKYTPAVVQETLRLYPSVPKDVKQAVNDDTLPDGTFIPAGSLVAYLPHAMGRMESNWGTQPDKFDPQRFLGEQKHSQFKFIAFNAGRRTCLGMHMALVEASFVLGLIYRKYRLEVVPGQTITYADSLTLPMKHGIKAKVIRLKD